MCITKFTILRTLYEVHYILIAFLVVAKKVYSKNKHLFPPRISLSCSLKDLNYVSMVHDLF